MTRAKYVWCGTEMRMEKLLIISQNNRIKKKTLLKHVSNQVLVTYCKILAHLSGKISETVTASCKDVLAIDDTNFFRLIMVKLLLQIFIEIS